MTGLDEGCSVGKCPDAGKQKHVRSRSILAMVDAFRPIYSQFMPVWGQDETMGGEQGRLAPDGDICRCQERPEQVKSTGHEQRAVGAGGEGGGRAGV